MKGKHLTYQSSGVSYTLLDSFKRLAQKEAAKTGRGIKQFREAGSRGESAFVWEESDCYRAFVTEGLGTKNLVADAMRKITGKTYYDAIAQDTVAMIVNDLIVVGAKPQVICSYVAAGSSDWFSDKKRVADLIKGWANACKASGTVWGGGETPTLKGIIEPGTVDLGGSAIGIIKPKKHLSLGDRLAAGDAIVLIESNGIHANGVTLARMVADKLPKGLTEKLDNGETYGEALLRPTHIYTSVVSDLLSAGIDIHYMVHITGHGWRKLMRANRRLTYVVDTIPPVPEVFSFIQHHSGNSDKEMYATFNMGAGFALYLPAQYVSKVTAIAKTCGFHAWHAGHVELGSKKVIIRPKNILFEQDSLQIRP